jgi:membrane-bound metal-dependent hydrolase YbcI (DUF457 family)
MPFTTYHLGQALFLGLLFLSFIDFPTFIIANVILDIEPFLILTLNLDYPLHGFFHSLVGGTVVAIPLAIIIFKIRDEISSLLSVFKLEQEISFRRIFVASLSGIYIHILFDSRVYTDIQPFYPLTNNPLLTTGILAGLDSYIICIWSFFAAIVLYMIRFLLIRRKS